MFKNNCILAAALFSALALPAHASTIEDTITFSASGLMYTTPETFSGSYTLTFDPTQTYTDATTGLTVNSLTGGSPLVNLNNIPAGFYYNDNFLIIGGLLNGVSEIVGDTNDYFLVINLANPATGELDVASSASPNDFFQDSTINISVTPASSTPEPSSLALFGTGILSLWTQRKRFSV